MANNSSYLYYKVYFIFIFFLFLSLIMWSICQTSPCELAVTIETIPYLKMWYSEAVR